MSSESKMLGQVENKSQLQKEVSVSTALLVLGSSAVGAYVGLRIGGPVGAAVGLSRCICRGLGCRTHQEFQSQGAQGWLG